MTVHSPRPHPSTRPRTGGAKSSRVEAIATPTVIKNAQRDILAHLVGDRVEVECVGKLGQAIGTGGEKLRHVQLLIPAVATSHGIQSLAAANACSGFG